MCWASKIPLERFSFVSHSTNYLFLHKSLHLKSFERKAFTRFSRRALFALAKVLREKSQKSFPLEKCENPAIHGTYEWRVGQFTLALETILTKKHVVSIPHRSIRRVNLSRLIKKVNQIQFKYIVIVALSLWSFHDDVQRDLTVPIESHESSEKIAIKLRTTANCGSLSDARWCVNFN